MCAYCRGLGIFIDTDRHCERSEAIQRPSGSLDCFVASLLAMTDPSMQSPQDILAGLWQLAGGEPTALDAVTLTGEEPVLPSSFRVGGLGAGADRGRRPRRRRNPEARKGEPQQPSRSTCATPPSSSAASATCASTANRRPPTWDKIAGIYRTGDARYVRLHTNFPHHRDGMLKVLGLRARARSDPGRAVEVGRRDVRDRGRAKRRSSLP